MRIAGPAAGSARLRTGADPDGTQVLGMLNNCALVEAGPAVEVARHAEALVVAGLRRTLGQAALEGRLAEGSPEARNHKRLGMPGNLYGWARFHERFDRSPRRSARCPTGSRRRRSC
jgi:secreted PhoX family phosphatase